MTQSSFVLLGTMLADALSSACAFILALLNCIVPGGLDFKVKLENAIKFLSRFKTPVKPPACEIVKDIKAP